MRILLLSASALTMTMIAAAAGAQETTSPLQKSASITGAVQAAVEPRTMSEIVVTAQRRSESLSRTPVAVSVLSGAALAERAIVTESDLQMASPGLTVRASENSNQLNYSLRGQSLDAFSNTRPGVLPYVNEVQIGGGGGSSAFYDLQSVQVLKGPQGTLFGRNATGGAVLFTTVKPNSELGGYLTGRIGDYNARMVEGAINVPVVKDVVLLRLSGFSQKRDGYQFNSYDDTRAGNVDRYGFRGSMIWKPTDKITNDLVVDYLHSDGNSLSSVLYSLNPNGAVPIIALTNFGNAAQFNAIISGFVQAAGGPPGVGAGAAAAYAAAHPTLDPGGVASQLSAQRARGPYNIAADSRNAYFGRNLVISDIAAVDVASDTTIRNIVGYTHLDQTVYGDIDGTPYGIDDAGPVGVGNFTRQFSDELQLVGKTFAKHLTYVSGLYFSSEQNRNLSSSNVLTFPIIASTQTNTSETKDRTLAGYAQGAYDLSGVTGVPGLAIIAGARYTNERVSLDILPGDTSFNDPLAVQAKYNFYQSKTFSNVSWTGGLQDQVNSNLLLYATSRRSYRNGGYNGLVKPIPGPGSTGGDGYGVETVTDVEFGLKFRGSVLSVPTRVNLAAYQDWISNSQRVAYTIVGGAPAALTVNVPAATVGGFEADGEIDPVSWLHLGGSLNYTDAKFTNNLVSISGAPPVVFGTYPDTPEWSGSVFGEIIIPLQDNLTVSLRADTFAQTSTYMSSTGNLNPGTQLPGYSLTNFRLGIGDRTAGWSVAGVVKNAFDRVYYVGGIGLGQLFQVNTAVPGDPRTFLIEASIKF